MEELDDERDVLHARRAGIAVVVPCLPDLEELGAAATVNRAAAPSSGIWRAPVMDAFRRQCADPS